MCMSWSLAARVLLGWALVSCAALEHPWLYSTLANIPHTLWALLGWILALCEPGAGFSCHRMPSAGLWSPGGPCAGVLPPKAFLEIRMLDSCRPNWLGHGSDIMFWSLLRAHGLGSSTHEGSRAPLKGT